MIGETVGNFEIISPLGKGGWGAVYLAQQKSIKTKVAIKVLEASVSTNTNHVERFFNEAVAVSQIHHSGIVKIFDVGFSEGGHAYLVMEYLEGETLTARIRKRTRLGIGMVADFGRQIASVLDATHTAGITHRDLKPDNIYLVKDAELVNGERVKVLDFGIAKLQQPQGGPRVTSLNAASVGTPYYMSPEQWHSLAEADWRTDAYALGCVAFEMACGRPPFLGESATDVCAQHLTESPPIPSKLVPGLPPELDHLIARLLEKEPAARPTMREAMQVFTQLGHSEGIALRSIPPSQIRSPFAPNGPLAASLAATAPATFSPTAGASQAMAAPQEPAPTKKPKRIGLFVAIGAVAIAGTVGAAVVIGTRDSEPAAKPAAASGSAGSNQVARVAPPDAAIAVVEVPDAAAVESPDAAVAVAVELDAGTAPPDEPSKPPGDSPIELKVALKPSQTLRLTTTPTLPVRFCVDGLGEVTEVGPASLGDSTRRELFKWRFAPHTVSGKPVTACFSMRMPKQPASPTARDAGSGKGSNTPVAVETGEKPPPPPPASNDEIDEGRVRATIGLARRVIEACGPAHNVAGFKKIRFRVHSNGQIDSQVLDPPFDKRIADAFATCIRTAVRANAMFPATPKGGKAEMDFIFSNRPPGSRNPGPQNTGPGSNY